MTNATIGSTSMAGLSPAISAPMAPSIRTPVVPKSKQSNPKLREQVGQFVGSIFYGTLFRQMQQSKIKGKYFHGGRGEDAFQAQLGMTLAGRMGRSPGDPIANRIYDALMRRNRPAATAGKQSATNPSAQNESGVQ